jgi:DNA-binding response OmpR family regulator
MLVAKVLLIDDDVELRDTYQDILEAAGHQVRCAGTLTHALAILPAFQPHVAFLDMQLNQSAGEVILILRRRNSRLAHTKFFIVSGFPERAARAAADWGADGWLGKPVSPADLRTLVEGVVEPEGIPHG